EELKMVVPDIGLSTDIIVGYPGESESEFEDTLALMEKIKFNNSYMFSYSSRPNTPAQDFPDSVPQLVKSARLQRTIELQKRLTLEQGKKFIGKEVDVLVESESFKPGADFRGRNAQYWSVNFTGDKKLIGLGDMVKVVVEEASGHMLKGRSVLLSKNEKPMVVESKAAVSTG
ncbi:MAG: TRAM domain-containing protein, partial [Nitrospinales bacterium]|nr:TRAM domain-containing protein [Nitrospinales bacterium]